MPPSRDSAAAAYDGLERRNRPRDRERTRDSLHETFRALGVDLEDQDSLNAFRSDLVHARKMRRLSERAGTAAIGVLVTAIVGGILGALIHNLPSVGK